VLITTDEQRGDCLGIAGHCGFGSTDWVDSLSAGPDNDEQRFQAKFTLRNRQIVRVAQLRVLS